MKKILFIIGSLRAKSFNRQLALEAKKLEAENAQIVASIRQLNVSPEELQSFLSSIKAKRGAAVISVSDKKDVMEEKAV